MATIIQIDFKLIDERVKHYLKVKKRQKKISTGDVIALLTVLEGASFPSVPDRINEPEEQIDYRKVQSSLSNQGNPLCKTFTKLEYWFQISQIINGEKLEANQARTELAKIMVNFICRSKTI